MLKRFESLTYLQALQIWASVKWPCSSEISRGNDPNKKRQSWQAKECSKAPWLGTHKMWSRTLHIPKLPSFESWRRASQQWQRACRSHSFHMGSITITSHGKEFQLLNWKLKCNVHCSEQSMCKRLPTNEKAPFYELSTCLVWRGPKSELIRLNLLPFRCSKPHTLKFSPFSDHLKCQTMTVIGSKCFTRGHPQNTKWQHSRTQVQFDELKLGLVSYHFQLDGNITLTIF